MHHDLHSLIDKYEEMTKKIGTYSSVDQLLTNTNMSYSLEIMIVLLPQKFKVPAIDMYNRSKDPMTLHGFFGKIACRAFPLTLKGMA